MKIKLLIYFFTLFDIVHKSIETEKHITDDDLENMIINLQDSELDHENNPNYTDFEGTQIETEEEFKIEGETDFDREIADFDPHDILTVVLGQNEVHNFYLNITEKCTIKASFMVLDENEDINYQITLPNKSIYYNIEKENHDFKVFETEQLGLYTFTLINKISKSTIKVNFAVHAGPHADTFITKSHLGNVNSYLLKIRHTTNQLERLKKTHSYRYIEQVDHSKSHNKSIITWSIIESIVLILVCFIQVKYVIVLLEKL